MGAASDKVEELAAEVERLAPMEISLDIIVATADCDQRDDEQKVADMRKYARVGLKAVEDARQPGEGPDAD